MGHIPSRKFGSETIAAVLALWSYGVSQRHICATMMRKGFEPPRGPGFRWHPSTVQMLLKKHGDHNSCASHEMLVARARHYEEKATKQAAELMELKRELHLVCVHASEMDAMLHRAEWSDHFRCPICRNMPDEGHKAACEMAQVLSAPRRWQRYR